jgi:thiol-disulfide isomerase/thioredoxin
VAGGSLAGTVSAAVALLTRSTMRSLFMIQGLRVGTMLVVLGLTATGAATLAGSGGARTNAVPPPAQTSKPTAATARVEPSLADRFELIRAEYRAQQNALSRAVEKAQGQREQSAIYQRMSPDDVAFSRRMVDLAASAPTDRTARDALLWILDKPYRSDVGAFGDEFARAAALLVRHHGDDPEAVRIGLGLENVLTDHRDALLLGFMASAKGREAKGLARLALAQYLEKKAQAAASARKFSGRPKQRFIGVIGDDGKPYDQEVEQSDEDYAYQLLLRQCDADGLRVEAERLYEEVIADYADVPCITVKHRELEALLKQPSPTWNGKPLTAEERQRLERLVARKPTLGQAALARLDEIRNLATGKPAPEIDGVDLGGTHRKLSDYRGKVVALVFWGSWCGPCLREVPRERDLVERLKGKRFAMLGVNCDGDDRAALKAIKDERITWPNWNDGEPGEGPIVKRYHIRGYPTVFVIDAQGIIRHQQVLGTALDQTVDELLKEMETKESSR